MIVILFSMNYTIDILNHKARPNTNNIAQYILCGIIHYSLFIELN